MIKKRTLLIPLFIATAALASCGGGGNGEAVTEQAGEAGSDAAAVVESAGDAATDMASDAAAAVEDTAGAVGDAIDPAAWQDIEMNWDNQISTVKETFPELSEEEIAGTAGKSDNLVSLLEQKYSISRDEAQARVAQWANNL